VAAGVPFPTFFISDHDETHTSGPPVPGLQYVSCRPLTPHTAFSVGRAVLRLAALAGELVAELP